MEILLVINREEWYKWNLSCQECLTGSQEAGIMKDSGHEEMSPFFFSEVNSVQWERLH